MSDIVKLSVMKMHYCVNQEKARRSRELVDRLYQEFKRRKIYQEREGSVEMNKLFRIQSQIRRDLKDLRLKKSSCIGIKKSAACDTAYFNKCYHNYQTMAGILRRIIRLDKENATKVAAAKAEAAAQALNP